MSNVLIIFTGIVCCLLGFIGGMECGWKKSTDDITQILSEFIDAVKVLKLQELLYQI